MAAGTPGLSTRTAASEPTNWATGRWVSSRSVRRRQCQFVPTSSATSQPARSLARLSESAVAAEEESRRESGASVSVIWTRGWRVRTCWRRDHPNQAAAAAGSRNPKPPRSTHSPTAAAAKKTAIPMPAMNLPQSSVGGSQSTTIVAVQVGGSSEIPAHPSCEKAPVGQLRRICTAVVSSVSARSDCRHSPPHLDRTATRWCSRRLRSHRLTRSCHRTCHRSVPASAR